MTIPPIPDAPNLPPWVKAYAEFNGQAVRIVDSVLLRQNCTCDRCRPSSRFLVGAGVFEFGDPDDPCAIGRTSRLPLIAETDSEAEALAEYHKQAELLRHREGPAEEGE